jgi:hypothetical protein
MHVTKEYFLYDQSVMTSIILQDIQKFGATLEDFTSLKIAKVHLTRYVNNV